jgi:trans-2,3-dihydro-3-hydroxyanthranilate isomerase
VGIDVKEKSGRNLTILPRFPAASGSLISNGAALARSTEPTMTEYHYRLVNVFTAGTDRLAANPLCVFEDARGLDDAMLQALARQFNLSETTFIYPGATATARVRIFTPTFEMPFAGHPTLGTAHVVRAINNGGDAATLEMKAGVIPLTAEGNTWTLQAGVPRWRDVSARHEQLAQMLGVKAEDVGDTPLWVDTGTEQLIVPLRSAAAVERCRPVAQLLAAYGRASEERHMAYAWATAGEDEIHARFFLKGTGINEDPRPAPPAPIWAVGSSRPACPCPWRPAYAKATPLAGRPRSG